MKDSLYKERSLLKFRRYYMHGIRNDFDFERASTEALWKAREEILSELNEDTSFENNAEKEEVWSQCMEMILIFKMILKDTPIDKAQLEVLRNKIKQEEQIVEKQLEKTSQSGASEVIGAAIVKGLEVLTTEGDKDSDARH